MRVVMDRKPLGGGRREVGIRLNGKAKAQLEPAAVERNRRAPEMKGLEDERGARGVLGGDPLDRCDLGEAPRAPGDVVGVVARRERRAVHNQPERRHPDRGFADEPLDLGDVEQSPEALALLARDDERLSLPVLVEEARLAERVERQPERVPGAPDRG